MNEFDIIEHYFRDLGARRADVLLGIGDDAAVLAPPPGRCVVAAVDTLVAGRHFPSDSPPRSIGHRALAVNLSDLAAMGAEPAYALLALTLPDSDHLWLQGFASGFAALAKEHGIALVGGDTTAGPLTVSVTVLGYVEPGFGLSRAGARVGDAVYVSGTPGDAAAGLPIAKRHSDVAALRARFEYPTPRVALGRALCGLASACIDVSDGLAGDLGKIGAASGVAIHIDPARLPLSAALRSAVLLAEAQHYALTGGDDYELAFTLQPTLEAELLRRLPDPGLVTRVGEVRSGDGIWLNIGSTVTQFAHRGFDHFGGA
jgi:thiamine-monophosphate kinase